MIDLEGSRLHKVLFFFHCELFRPLFLLEFIYIDCEYEDFYSGFTCWEKIRQPCYEFGSVMENIGKRVDVARLLSLGDDLIGVLNNRKDGDNLMQSLESMKALQSSCEMDSCEVQNLQDG